MTIKIVDNTFISACIAEISCINLLNITSEHYAISTTSEVYQETVNGFEMNFLKEAYDIIDVFTLDHDKYHELKEWLENRYPQIDTGEISSFLLALLNYAIKGGSYYYVTDDRKMKKIILKLNKDLIFMDKLGIEFNMENFNVTGTVGLIIRLISKQIISKDYVEPIIIDMENNGFYMDNTTKNHLRGI